MNTSLTKEEKLVIKNSKEKIIYSEDGTRLLKACGTTDYVEVKSGTLTICDGAFGDNEFVREVKLPDSIVEIGRRAFENCKSLFTIDIPEKVDSISAYCFKNCEHLANIEFPDGLTEIGDSAFMYCKALTDVTFPPKLKIIDKFAFLGSGISRLEMKSDISCSVYERAFAFCVNLENAFLGKNVILRDGEEHPAFTFGNCTGLKEIHFESGDTCCFVAKSMLRGCSSLERIVLPVSKYPNDPDFNADSDEYAQFSIRDFNSLVVHQ